MIHKPRRPRGYTLLEVVISMVILAIVFTISLSTIDVMGDGMRTEMTMVAARADNQHAVDLILDNLRRMRDDGVQDHFHMLNGGVTVGGTTPSGDEVRFRLLTSDNAGNLTWGDRVTYAWRPSPEEDRDGNGVDDTPGVDGDGNGLVDDGVIYRTYADSDGDGFLLYSDMNLNGLVDAGEYYTDTALDTAIVLTHVPPGGFVLTKDGRELTITVVTAGDTRVQGGGTVNEVRTTHTYFMRNGQ